MTNPHKVTRSGVTYWQSFGECASDRRRFNSTRERDVEAAKHLCRRCFVREQCMKAALSDRNATGTWGALTAEERAKYRRVMGAPVLGTRR